MSTENPFIPIFDGLGGLQTLVDRLVLDVRSTKAAYADQLEPGGLIRLPAHDLRRIGLKLRSDWTDDEVRTATAEASLGLEQVAFIVTAEDGFLKERLQLGDPLPATSLPRELTLVGYNGDRREALRNQHRGFTLDVHLVLENDIDPVPFRPHRKGTILARSTFKVRPQRDRRTRSQATDRGQDQALRAHEEDGRLRLLRHRRGPPRAPRR